MKKRIFLMLIGLMLLICVNSQRMVVAEAAEEYEIIASGVCGENLSWQLDDKGVLTISGTGAMESYTNSNRPWYEHKSKINSVKIQEGVTSVGTYAFFECRNIVNVMLPDSIDSIEACAFSHCTELSKIVIPNGVTEIGYRAFECCLGLSSIIIPEGVTKISGNSFSDCVNLLNVTIPSSVTEINSYAFHNTGISSLKIPNGVNEIGQSAFGECSDLNNIEIPASVIKIDSYVFADCYNLTEINVDIENIRYSSKEGVLFNKEQTLLICCPAGKKGTYIIPDGVKTIGKEAFEGCLFLNNIIIPTGVTNIEISAFERCRQLESVNLPNTMTEIARMVFMNCDNMNSISIPNSVSKIDAMAFLSCDSLHDVYYDGSEEEWNKISISYSNESLTNATIHYNTTNIEFTHDTSLAYFRKWDAENQIAYFDNDFYGCTIADSADPVFLKNIEELVGKYVLTDTWEQSMYNVVLPEHVIGKVEVVTNDGVEKGSSYLTSITIDGTKYPVSGNRLYDWATEVGDYIIAFVYNGEVMAVDVLEERCGFLGEDTSTEGRYLIDYKEYPSNYLTDTSYKNNIGELLNSYILYYVSSKEIPNQNLPSLVKITETPEEYFLKVWSSADSLAVDVSEQMKLTCTLCRYGKPVTDWKNIAFTIENTNVIQVEQETGSSGKYHLYITGLSEGDSELIVTDTESGANICLVISVGDITGDTYSCRMDVVPSFYPKVFGDTNTQTNFYNVNGLYVNNFSYIPRDDGDYDVKFNVYNESYMHGSVDVFDADGKWIGSKKIEKKTDISSLWDSGDAVVNLVTDTFRDKKGMSYTTHRSTEKTEVNIIVPKGGYFTISNNMLQSYGTYLYNMSDFIMKGVEAGLKLVMTPEQKEVIGEEITEAAIENLDFQELFYEEINKIALNTTSEPVVYNIANTGKIVEKAEYFTVSAESFLDQLEIEWRTIISINCGIAENVFFKLGGPAGFCLEQLFKGSELYSDIMQTVDILNSTDNQFVTIHTPLSSGSTTIHGVMVTPDEPIDNSDAVLQVFRIANAEEWEKSINQNYECTKYEVFNICLADGADEVQPKGNVEVRIKVPSSFDGQTSVVLRQEKDGSWTNMNAVLDGDFLVFDTEHFSVYVVAELNVSEVSVEIFADVPEDTWYVDSVLYVYKNGYMTGVGTDADGLIIFEPETKIPREQFVTVLWKKERPGDMPYTERFIDVADDQWYTDAVLWAEQNNIVNGIDATQFGLGVQITREQIATMLYRYATEYKGYDTALDGSVALSTYEDGTQVSSWAQTAMQWAVERGIITGKLNAAGDGNMLDSAGLATRAECATMLQRFISKYE